MSHRRRTHARHVGSRSAGASYRRTDPNADNFHHRPRQCGDADAGATGWRRRIPGQAVRRRDSPGKRESGAGALTTPRAASRWRSCVETFDNRVGRYRPPDQCRFEQIIGGSPAPESVVKQVERVAPTQSTLLLLGETGTGKELISPANYTLSPSCGRAFVKVNCAAIPLDLLESELFGHEKGAFTGAIAQKIGRFEVADRGTLFLDEVGDIPLALQPKLLRVLQEQEFERLGGT